MKNILTTAAFLIFSLGAMAQQTIDDQDEQQTPDEQLEQQQFVETQIQVERSAERDAQRTKAERMNDKQKELEQKNANALQRETQSKEKGAKPRKK